MKTLKFLSPKSFMTDALMSMDLFTSEDFVPCDGALLDFPVLLIACQELT